MSKTVVRGASQMTRGSKMNQAGFSTLVQKNQILLASLVGRAAQRPSLYQAHIEELGGFIRELREIRSRRSDLETMRLEVLEDELDHLKYMFDQVNREDEELSDDSEEDCPEPKKNQPMFFNFVDCASG